MIPRPFEYHAPRTLPDALGLLRQLGDEAKLLAGGHSLLPMMKLRFAQPEHLIDLGRIAELKGIHQDGDTLVIGAMTVENEIIWSALLQSKCPLLVEGARQIADPQVRYRGTIGGDIAHGDPGNDHPALMLVLGASFVLCGSSGERIVAADDFFVGAYTTAMRSDEILTQIRIPVPAQGTGYCYAKLKRKTGDFAAAAAAVQLRLSGGAVQSVRIALTNAGPTPLRATKAEELLRGKKPDDGLIVKAASLAMSICAPSPDQRGDVQYKTAMTGEMTIRALTTARQRAA
ncbi:MAG: FAD binding domain-containing protein [Steroidobacterales bacterium]